MRAVILAAGRGSRMASLTDMTHKCLLEVFGRPLLDWQLEAFSQSGVTDVAIVTGYKRELLADRGLTEFYNPRWHESQSFVSLLAAKEWLNDGPCIISYSDIFYEPKAVRSLIKSDSPIAVTYDPKWLELWAQRFKNPLDDAESFRINSDAELLEIGRQAKSTAEIQGQYMGLLRFTPAGWSLLRDAVTDSAASIEELDLTASLQLAIERRRQLVFGIPYHGKWGEVDSQDDLDFYNNSAEPLSLASTN